MVRDCTGQILSTDYAAGAVHDFKLLKRTLKTLPRLVRVLADKEYQELQRLGVPCVTTLSEGNLPFGRRLSEFYVNGAFGWSLSLHG